MLAAGSITDGLSEVCVAGGMEGMTNAPFLLTHMRVGKKIGNDEVPDHLVHYGLEDAYERSRSMGEFAEDTAERFGISREEQDEFARRSVSRSHRK